MEAKPISRSKTIWFNALTIAGWGLAALVSAVSGEAAPELPEQLSPYALVIVAVGNLLLRFVTRTAIDLQAGAGAGGDQDDPGGGGGPPLPAEAATDAPTDDDEKGTSFRLFAPAACLAAGLLAGGAEAAAPRAVIEGPSGGIPGDRVVLDASRSDADVFRWDVERRGYGPLDTHYVISTDQRECELQTYPGTYDVTLSVANGEGIDVRRKTVVIWGVLPPSPPGPEPPAPQPEPPQPEPQPEPEPEPTPPPPPEPVPPEPDPDPGPDPEPGPEPEPEIPDGRFGVAERIYEWGRSVRSDNRAAEAELVAEDFAGIAERIRSGEVRGTNAIREALEAATAARFSGATRAAWRSGFGVRLAALIAELLLDGALRTWQDWVDLFLEIAAALVLVE